MTALIPPRTYSAESRPSFHPSAAEDEKVNAHSANEPNWLGWFAVTYHTKHSNTKNSNQPSQTYLQVSRYPAKSRFDLSWLHCRVITNSRSSV